VDRRGVARGSGSIYGFRRTSMATFRIQSSGQEPRIIPLRGDHITIGRRPDNTVEISEPTLSARHAEMVRENGRYRLRDLGSTNGTFVNGQPVKDFHLHGRCKISFGSCEVEFDPNADASLPPALPPQVALAAVRSENATLREQIDATRAALEKLRAAPAAPTEPVVPKQEYDCLVAEKAALEERLKSAEKAAGEQGAQLATDEATLRKELEAVRAEKAGLLSRLDAMLAESERKVAREDFEKLQREHAGTLEQLRATDAQAASLRDAAGKLVPQADLERAVAERAEMAEQVRAAQSQIDGLRGVVEGSVPRTELESLERERATLSSRVQESEDQLTALRREMAQMVPRAELDQIKLRHAATQEELQSAREAGRAELESALAERDRFRNEAEAKEAEIRGLREELAGTVPKQEHDRVLAERNAMEEALRSAEEKVVHLQAEGAGRVPRSDFDGVVHDLGRLREDSARGLAAAEARASEAQQSGAQKIAILEAQVAALQEQLANSVPANALTQAQAECGRLREALAVVRGSPTGVNGEQRTAATLTDAEKIEIQRAMLIEQMKSGEAQVAGVRIRRLP
jgi:hypothetical protein